MQQTATPSAQQGKCFFGGKRPPNIIKGLQERAGYSPKRLATRHVRPFHRTACHAGTIKFPIHHECGKVDSCVRYWPNGFASIERTIELNTRHIDRPSSTLWRQQLLCWSRRIARATTSLCRREVTDSGDKLAETITHEVCRVKYGHG